MQPYLFIHPINNKMKLHLINVNYSQTIRQKRLLSQQPFAGIFFPATHATALLSAKPSSNPIIAPGHNLFVRQLPSLRDFLYLRSRKQKSPYERKYITR